MIKNIIYVEDGSIDVNELVDSLDETTKVIVYRQGSHPPILIQPQNNINSYTDSILTSNQKAFETVKTQLEKAFGFKMSKKLKKLLDELYIDLFC